MALTFFVITVSFLCKLCIVRSERYDVTIQTLNTGTDGKIRIKLFGILGETDFVDIGEEKYFELPNFTKKKLIQTATKIDSVLKVALTVVGGHSAHIGVVTILEKATDRKITYNFQTFISQGAFAEKDSPSPDLSDSKIFSSREVSRNTVTINEGEQLLFSTKVNVTTANSGQPSYRWFKKSVLSSNFPEEISTSSDYTFDSTNTVDGGLLFCVISLGESVLKTNEINLVVNYLWIQPLQVVITGSTFIEEGSAVQFICAGSSNKPDITASWMKGDELLQTKPVSLSYKLNSISRSDSGEYACKVEVNDGTLEARRKLFKFNVIYLDEPVINGENIVNNTLYISANETVQLRCLADGFPVPYTYTIMKNGYEVVGSGELNNTFTVEKAAVGNYTCVAQNHYLKTHTFIFINTTNLKGLTKSQTDQPSADGFWSTEMIVVIVVVIVIVCLVVIIIIIICLLRLRSNSKDKIEVKPEATTAMNDTSIFFKSAAYPDSYNHGQINREHVATNHPTSSIISASSDEYISSNNDLSSMVSREENIPAKILTKGKDGRDKFELNTVFEEEKPNEKHINSARLDEVLNKSNWARVNESKANLDYRNVEYC